MRPGRASEEDQPVCGLLASHPLLDDVFKLCEDMGSPFLIFKERGELDLTT